MESLESDIAQQVNSKKDIRVEVIIPTLNEESTIEKLILDIKKEKLPVNTSILVIDGGSKDNTVAICKKQNVRVIQQKGKGKGLAMREAVEHTDTDIVVFIDGDGTYSVSDLQLILEPILLDKADMVVGSRISGNIEKGSISRLNKIGNTLFNKTINFALKSKVTDSLSGYRALRRETFRDLILFSTNFEIEVEMTVESLSKGYRVLEVPISYGNRKGTQTKLNPTIDGAKIARTLLFISMNVNPIKFFSLFALGFILIGMIPASQVIFEKITLGDVSSFPSVVLSTLLFVTAALAFVVGLLSELVVRSRKRLEYMIKMEHRT